MFKWSSDIEEIEILLVCSCLKSSRKNCLFMKIKVAKKPCRLMIYFFSFLAYHKNSFQQDTIQQGFIFHYSHVKIEHVKAHRQCTMSDLLCRYYKEKQ